MADKINEWEEQEIAFIESPLIAKAIKLRGFDARSFYDNADNLFPLCDAAHRYACDYHRGQNSEAYAMHSFLHALRYRPGMGFTSSHFFGSEEFSEAVDWLVFIGEADGIKINYETGEIEK